MPTAKFSVRRLHFKEGTSDKFWAAVDIRHQGMIVSAAWWGRRGSNGQWQRGDYFDINDTRYSKMSKGYRTWADFHGDVSDANLPPLTQGLTPKLRQWTIDTFWTAVSDQVDTQFTPRTSPVPAIVVFDDWVDLLNKVPVVAAAVTRHLTPITVTSTGRAVCAGTVAGENAGAGTVAYVPPPIRDILPDFVITESEPLTKTQAEMVAALVNPAETGPQAKDKLDRAIAAARKITLADIAI